METVAMETVTYVDTSLKGVKSASIDSTVGRNDFNKISREDCSKVFESLGDTSNFKKKQHTTKYEEDKSEKESHYDVKKRTEQAKSPIDEEKSDKKLLNYGKVLRELQDTKHARRKLEEAYQMLAEADRQKANDMRKMSNENKLELARICRESHQEVRKLMDEIRSKDRVIVHLEKELGYKSTNKRSANSTNTEIISMADGDRYQMRIADLSRKLRRTEEECQQLNDEKTEMTKRLKDLERRLRPAQEKTRRYLNKNMDLTSANRGLEDQIKKQGDENSRMKSQLEDIKRRMETVMTSLAQEKIEKTNLQEMTRKFEQAQKEVSDLQRGLALYKKECSEKDRRIELLKHFQKQARELKINNKEMEERRKLSAENRRLKDQLRMLDNERKHCEQQLSVTQEQNESLEFRVLELEEIVEKLDDNGTDAAMLTHEEREEATISLMDILDIDVGELMGRMDQMKKRLKSYMKPAEKTIILKAKAMIDIADKRLKAAQKTERALKDRIENLEKEKTELLSHATGVSPDCVLEYEENRGKLEEAQQKIDELEDAKKQSDDRNKAQAYQNEIDNNRLKSAQGEIDNLKKQIQSLHEGRENEESVMKEMGRYKDGPQKIGELENQLKEAKCENEELKEQLTSKGGPTCKDVSVLMNMKKLKDRISEVEKENDLLKNSELGETVMELKAAKERISDLEWEKEKLDVEIDVLKKRNHELEGINAEISQNFSELNNSIHSAKHDVDKMRDKLSESGSEERTDLSKDNERLRSELFMAKQEISQVDKELNSLEDSFVKINDENDKLKKQVEKSVDKMAVMRNEIAKLKTSLNAKDYEISELKKSFDKTKEDLTKARKAYVVGTQEIDDLKKKLQAVEGEKEALENQIDEESPKGKERKKLQREHRVADEIIKEEVANNLEAWSGELSDSGLAEDSADVTPKRMSPDQLFAEEKAELQKKIVDLTTEKEELEKDIDALRANEDRLKVDVAGLGEENKDKDNRLTELEREMDSLKDNENQLKQELERKNNQISKLEKEMEEKDKELEKEKMDKEKLSEEHDNAEREKNLLNEKLTELEDVLKDRGSLDDKCQSLALKNMDLMQLVSDAQEKESALRNEIQNLKDELETLRETESRLKSEMEEVKYDSYDKIGNLKEEIQKLKKNEEKLSESLQESEETERDLRDRLDMIQNPQSDVNRQLASLRKDNDELNDKLDELEDKLNTADNANDQKEKKYEDELKDLEIEKEKLSSETELLKDKITRLEDEVDRLEDELVNSKDKNDQLHDALSKATKRVDDLDLRVADNDEVINDLNSQIDKRDRKISELKEDLEEKDSVIEKQNAEIMEKEKLIDDTDVKIAADKSKIRDLEDKLDVLTSAEDRLLDQVRDLEAELHGSRRSSPQEGLQNRNASDNQNDREDELLGRIRELERKDENSVARIHELELSEQILLENSALAELESAASDTSADFIQPTRQSRTLAAPPTDGSAARTAPDDSETVVNVRVKNADVLEGLRNGARTFASKGDLEDLSHEQLIERLQGLEEDRIKDKRRIKDLENGAGLRTDKNGEPLLESGDAMGKSQSTVQSDEPDSGDVAKDDVISQDVYHGDASMDPSNQLDLSNETGSCHADEESAELERLRESEQKLKDELAAAKRAQDDTELLARIDKLKKSERELDAKLSTYDSQDVESLARRLSDVSDDELRRKVVELERMEKHLNTQIAEMEEEQDMLNEISREDKDTIHDLNIELKEQQSLTENLRDQLAQLEATEAELLSQSDQIQTEVEDLEDQLNRVKRSEKRFKDEVRQLKDRELEANKKSLDLEDQITDLTTRENKLQNQTKSLESENQQLQERLEKLQERLYDLESNEIIDKQQIRELEKRFRKLQSDLASVVTKGSSPQDMHSLNDNLQRKCTNLEQERAGLGYEVADLGSELEELRKNLALAQSNEQTLKSQLSFHEGTQRKFQKRTKDLELNKLELMDQIDDLEKDKLRPLSPMPQGRLGGKDAEIERLQDDLEASQQKVRELQKTVKNLKQQNSDDGNLVTIPHAELLHLQQQNEKLRLVEQKLHLAEKTNTNLMESLKKIRAGKSGDGQQELEIRDLQNQIDYLNSLLKEKQAARHAGELIVESDDMQDGDIITIRKPGKRAEKGSQSENSELMAPVAENGHPTQPGHARPSSADEDFIRPVAAKRDQSAPRDFSEPALDRLSDALSPLALTSDSSSRRSSCHLPESDQEAEEEELRAIHQNRDETLPDFDRLDHPEKYQPKESKPKSREPSPRRASRDPSPRAEAREQSPKRRPSQEPSSANRATDKPAETQLQPSQVAPKQSSRDRSPRRGQDSHPGEATPIEQRTPMSSPEKKRRNKNKEYDGDSDSSMDEAPIAGMNRRESQLFDVPQVPAETLPEPKAKARLVKEPTADSEDLSVSMQLSDESQPNSPRRDRVKKEAARGADDIEEEGVVAPSRSSRSYYSPDSVHNDRREMHDVMPEARVNVPNRRRRPSDGSAADSGIHSNVHSQIIRPQTPDEYDRSSTPSRSGPYEPSHGVPHLSPWLTNQLVDQKSSGTNTDNFKHRAEKKEWPVGPLRHIATDTEEMIREDGDEIKRLKQIIADLQCDLKVKQRELETARFVVKGLEEKVKGAEDSFTWKAKVKERERDLSNKDRLLRNIMDENVGLMDEIQDRQRQIVLLQAEVDNLDVVCKAKDAEGGPGTISRLKEELDKAQTSLADVIGDREELDVDNKAMKHQIEMKNKDILDKTERIDELNRELKRATNSMKEAEQSKMEIEGKLRSVELELEKMKGADTRLQNIRDEFADVKNKNVDMEDTLHNLEKDKLERDELRSVVANLKDKLRNYEEVKADKADLDHRVQTMQKLLDNKCKEAERLANDGESLKTYINQMETDGNNSSALKHRLDESEAGKTRAEQSVSPLRAKVIRLGDKCREKDDMIRRLVVETKKAGASESPVVREAEKMKQVMPQEEYNRPMSPMTVDKVDGDVIKPTAVATAHSSAFELPHQNGRYNHHHDSDIIPTRLEKSEAAPDHSRIPLPMEHLPPLQPQSPARSNRPSSRPGSFHPYDPRQQEGRPQRPLSSSSMNGSDFLHNVPLPADGLTEILPTTVIRSEHNKGSSHTLDRSERQKARSMDRRKNARGIPNPPTDFHIARILSDRNVMVAWQPPHVDELDRSNGAQIAGYKISVDDIEKHKVSSPHLSKALIGRLDLHRPHKISIQSYGTKGELSPPVNAYFEDSLNDTRGSNSDLGSVYLDDDVDASSMTSMNAFKNNEPKTFMAVYDYDPSTQSPNPYPNSELAFKTGDLIMTYGRVRQDGFYNAKIRGKKGLVPASFIEAVPINKKPKRHASRPGSSTNLNANHPTL